MNCDYILTTLDKWENAQADTLISSLDPAVRQAAEAVMAHCRELRYIIHRHEDADIRADTIDSVIARLHNKCYLRTTDAVIRDNIRLASNQLRRLKEPEPEYTEPIDIFDLP